MMAIPEQAIDVQPVEARERLAVAAGAALLVAGLVLVAVVLPAEYGIDPLGTGAKLGLTALDDARQSAEAFSLSSESGEGLPATILVPQDREYKQETIEFVVGPRDFVEYKYRLDKGEALLFSWKSTGRVDYDFHAEPDGAPSGYAESYEQQKSKQLASGTLTAPFSGIHGWYWENLEDHEVTITLTSAGFYNMSHEFRDGAEPKTKTFQ
jgi:hypothetical protein